MGHVPGVTNSRSCPSGSPSKRWCHDLITPLNPRPLVSPPDRTLTEMKGDRTDRSWLWGRLTFCGLMFLTALRLVRLLRRRSLLYRWPGRRSLCNLGLRSRSMMDRRRWWRFDFLLRRRGRVHFGSRFSDSHSLAMGGRHWSRLWRGDFSRGCFYLGGRFRRCHVRRLIRRRRGRFGGFLVRRLMRRRVRWTAM